MQRCSTEDLLAVALPKLTHIASLWDFLSASLPKGKKSISDVSSVLQEYNRFRCQVPLAARIWQNQPPPAIKEVVFARVCLVVC